MSTESALKEDYAMAHDPDELARLTKQHFMLMGEMQGRLILTQTNFDLPGRRVLDCACADGLWLRDVCGSVPNGTSHEYIGIDIQTSFFPATSQPCLSLVGHSMQSPFPPSWITSFDLVHMRFGLAAAGELGPGKVIAHLATLVRPGGSMQLAEADWLDFSGCGPVFSEALVLFGAVFDTMGVGSDYARRLGSWMQAAGIHGIDECIYKIRIGAQNPNPDLGRAGTAVVCQAAGTMCQIALRMNIASTKLPSLDMKTLVSRLQEELSTQGGSYSLKFAWGQRL